jgi:CBS domain containing-hemolysin-like protein
MDPSLGFPILVLLTLLGSFWTALENALASLGRVRVTALLKEHSKHRKLLQELLEHPALIISSIAFLRDISVGVGAIVALLTIFELFPNSSLVIQLLMSLAVLGVNLLLFGEILPKYMGREQMGGWVLRFLRLVYIVTRPLNPVMAFVYLYARRMRKLLRLPGGNGEDRGIPVSEEQLKFLLEAAEEHGLLDEEEEQMIWRILAYDDLIVRQVMVPRPEVITFSVDTSIDEVREAIEEHGYSRYPVYEGTRDTIIGVLYAKDLLRFGFSEKSTLRDLVREPFFTPTIKPINKLLREFQRHKRHIAIVVDEFGSMAGIITLEDVLEEIVGEITDEFDQPETPIRKLSRLEYLVDGDTELSQLNEELELALPIDGAVTVGGLITQELEEIPRAGRSLSIDGCTLVVENATAREILKVRVQLAEGISTPHIN